jgi:predicted HAD superfamily Cof-like phosphohydrolase
MNKQLQHVEDFHKAFRLTVNQEPVILDENTAYLRYALLNEENQEYYEACLDNNLEEIVDALGDQLYIVLGTIITHGCQDIIEDVFDEIQRSNMSKLGDDGKPIINGVNYTDDTRPLGKVIKGKNWSPPNIKQFLKK